MGSNSSIEWTHHTFNPWRGCTKVSQGCKHCYAETMSGRNPAVLGVWGKLGSRPVAAESYWRQPIKWDAEARAAGERRRVFCASLADVFEGEDTMPAEAWAPVQAARRRLFNLIIETPHLDWLLLTKRPQNIKPILQSIPVLERDNVWDHLWPDHFPNVWIGTSVENQSAADERIPHLLNVPSRVRFLSCEPLLGQVDIGQYLQSEVTTVRGYTYPMAHVNWVICGGESGPHARPMHPEWARSLRNQCTSAGVAFHFKQHGEYRDGVRMGKHAAGRLLDGQEWNQFPA